MARARAVTKIPLITGTGSLLLFFVAITAAADNVRSLKTAWDVFLQGDGKGWTATWEPAMAVPSVVRPSPNPLPDWTRDHAAAMRAFFTDHRELFGMRQGLDEVVVKSEREYRGIHHLKVGQLHRGIPVLDVDYAVSVGPDAAIRLISGQSLAGVQCDVSPRFTAQQAEARARREVVGQRGPYRVTNESTLGIVRVSNTDHLVYVIQMESEGGVAAWKVLVDAHDGTVIRRDDLVMRAQGCAQVYPDDPSDALEDRSFTITDQYPAVLSGPAAVTQGYGTGTLVNDGAWDPFNNCWDFRYDPVEYPDSFDQANAYWHAEYFLRAFHGLGALEPEPPNYPGLTSTNAGAIIGNLPFQVRIQVRDPYVFGRGRACEARGSFVNCGVDPNRNVSFANVSDILYHEIQHTISEYMGLGGVDLPGQGTYALAFNESFSNYFACAANNDGIFEEYYAPGGLFNPENDRSIYNYGRFDVLYVPNTLYAPYVGGMVWSGTLWDLRQQIGPLADQIAFASYLYLPTNPTFQCGAAALVQADLDYFSGAHEAVITQVLQGRGYGIGPPIPAIQGPDRMSAGQSGTFTSSICCGIRPYQLAWTKVPHPAPGVDGTPQNLGTASQVTTTFTGPFRLELRVTDGRSHVGLATYEVRYPIPDLSWFIDGQPFTYFDQFRNAGQNVTFSVNVTGGGPNPTFQWTKTCRDPDCTPVVFGTTQTAITSFQRNAYVEGTVTIFDETYHSSNTLSLRVNGVPSNGGINGADILPAGQTATYSVFFNGGALPYTYRWMKGCFGTACVIGTSQQVTITGDGSDFVLWASVTSATGLQSDAAWKQVRASATGPASLGPDPEPGPAAAPEAPGLVLGVGRAAAGERVTVNLTMPTPGRATVQVVDVSGRIVSRLHDGALERGASTLTWDTNNVPSGVYFIVGRAGDRTTTKRTIVIH